MVGQPAKLCVCLMYGLHHWNRIGMNDADFKQLPLLDAEVLTELREIMEDGFADLIRLFLHDAPLQFNRLQTAVAQGDANDLYQTAHKFKSTCGSIGAIRLAEIIRRLELAGRQSVLEGTVELLRHAQSTADETFRGLQTELG